jgi:hypothetical protein
MNGTFEIQPGECFGCLALKGRTFQSHTFQGAPWCELLKDLSVPLHARDDYWLSKEPPFAVDGEVKRQFGEFVVEKLNANVLVLTAKRRAPRPYHPLEDGKEERQRVTYFQSGLAIWLGIPHFDEAVLLIGRRDENRTHVLPLALRPGFWGSVSDLWSHSTGLIQAARQRLTGVVSRTSEAAQWSLVERIGLAVEFARRLKQIIDSHEEDYATGRKPPRYWRMNSGVAAFLEACRSRLYHVRIHQYVRAIESFLPPTAWGEKQFADKAGVLSGTDQQTANALKEIYRLRNKAEHHEYFEDAQVSGSVAEQTAWLRAWQAEVLCLELYRRLFTKSSVFINAYSDSDSIKSFWANGAVQAEWGVSFPLPRFPSAV